MTAPLGRLEKVDLREAWENEAGDFTPWLGREDNLSLLGEIIGLELELEAQERNVGPFRADLLCKDTVTGHWVLIENQLERTDHCHLGQLLTYAAGLQAVTVVWIAPRFTEEHRATLDWLNNITNEQFNFFGLEIELWRIGDSPCAPKFNVISKPNDWTKTISGAAGGLAAHELTATQQLQLEYWTALRDALQNAEGKVRPRKPFPDSYYNFAIGRSGVGVTAWMNTKEPSISVVIYIDGPHAGAYFGLLQEQREAIEDEIGEPLRWSQEEGRNARRIQLVRLGADALQQENWPQLLEWHAEKLELFYRVFQPRIAGLNVSDYMPSEGEPDEPATE